MTEIWFTADSHFGHKAMAAEGKGWRPFETVEEHDEHLIQEWNKIVRAGDQVWHLGDVGMGPEAGILEKVSRLNGHKHLITGNHDDVWPGHKDSHRHQRTWLEVFESVQAYARRRIDGQDVLLSHFPYGGDHTEDERYTTYRLKDTGLWLIHGHVHDAWKVKDRQINVGVDMWDWRPVSINQLTTIIRETI